MKYPTHDFKYPIENNNIIVKFLPVGASTFATKNVENRHKVEKNAKNLRKDHDDITEYAC